MLIFLAGLGYLGLGKKSILLLFTYLHQLNLSFTNLRNWQILDFRRFFYFYLLINQLEFIEWPKSENKKVINHFLKKLAQIFVLFLGYFEKRYFLSKICDNIAK